MTKKLNHIIFLLAPFILFSQENTSYIKVSLDTLHHIMNIEQKIVYHNKSKKTLDKIYLHNWANSFKNNETPLGKRLVEDYKKDFYFSKEINRGYSKIHFLKDKNGVLGFQELQDRRDIIQIQLNTHLKPEDSIEIMANYTVKIPQAKFTGYGKTENGYHLRFWYLTPAVYDNGWQLMSNLNMDDLYEDVADYIIELRTPKIFKVESNLYQYKISTDLSNDYYLIGKRKKDIILIINKKEKFKVFKTKNTQIKTDIFDKRVTLKMINEVINRQVEFIEKFMGNHPHPEVLVDGNTVNKNSLKDIYGIPNWLKPYPENFKWDIRFFKALTSKYINDILLLNTRNDYWLRDGIQTFLMIEYINKFYPEITVFGRFSKIWGFKNYNLAKLKQNDKYTFFYQFSARRFYDQALTISSDSLSNFNRKIVNPYKAGLGFKYLQDFIGNEVLKKSFQEFYTYYRLKPTNSTIFKNILTKNTSKNLDWFFDSYITTSKKIDYKIKNVQHSKVKDSLEVTIKNKRNITAPVSLYGITDKKIKFKTWVTNVDSVKTITIKSDSYDKLALNYEQIYPEYNFLNNYKKPNNSFINKPLQFRFLKDIEDPYYTQVFYNPSVKFNLYDGAILGINFNNRAVIKHNFEFSITPNYAFKSKNLTSSFSLGYNQFFEESKLYKIRYGVSGSNFHYAPELSYNTFSPFVNIQFRRNTLRDVGVKFLLSRIIYVDREINTTNQEVESDKYQILNFRYIYNKPDVIRRFQYAVNGEFADNFTKFSSDIRYLKFFNEEQSFNFRLFGGFFLSNKSNGSFFSFGLNQSSDYLFEQNLFGRSERSGLFSQQFVISDGGFKSFFNESSYANQMILSANTSVSIWRWAEIYNDIAMLKNKNKNPKFFYENGIRFNFIPNIFEFYFPIYINEGFEINQRAYPSKIRFVVTTSLDRIYNFIRRGLL